MSQRAARSDSSLVRLDDESIARLADALADRLRQRGIAGAWMTADDIAAEHRVSSSWVYAHKLKLGGEPLGSGPKPRWRFLRARVEAYFHEGCAAAVIESPGAPRATRELQPVARRVELLPVRGVSA